MGADSPRAGRFVWHDLRTKDLDTSLKFYADLFGWTVELTDMGPLGRYHMLKNGGQGIGGIVPLDASQRGLSHWIDYVTVDDVDRAAERVGQLGGRVTIPPMDIPGIGRFAVATDPSGAQFSPFRFEQAPPPEADGPTPIGSFCWTELLTRDPSGAVRFYGEICGWSTQQIDVGAAGTYTLFKRGERDAAGVAPIATDAAAGPHWLSYVAVDDVDAAASRIRELDGQVRVEPRDVPGIGRFAAAADPTGAAFAVFRGVP